MSAHPQQRTRARLYAAAPLALVALVLASFALDRALQYDSVLRGVWVEDVALSGLGRSEAEQALAQLGDRLRSTPLSVRVDRELLRLDPAKVGFRLDLEGSLERALAAGRSGHLPSQLGWWLARWGSPSRVRAVADLDAAALDRLMSSWEERAIADRPHPGGIVAKDGRVVAEPPRRGRRIDRERARQALLDALVLEKRPTLELPLVEVTPESDPKLLDDAARRASELVSRPVELHLEERDAAVRTLRFEREDLLAAIASRVIDGRAEPYFDPDAVKGRLGPLRAALEKPPRNAELVVDARDRVSIEPSRAGTLVRAQPIADALLQAAAAPGKTGPLPIVRGALPERTTDDLLALKIRGLVARFSTHHACCQARVHNIHRIADLVDGTIVEPGEIVSLNALAGPRTVKNGFVAAPSIEDGEMVDALGGGVSQFATTFFNALFHGGYDILERQPHTYYFSRYPMGHEATLSWPKPDIIFKNDTQAGLLIKTHYTDTSITVKLYGDNGGRKVQAKVSAQQDIVKPPVELLPDPELSPDREKVKESGQIGWSVIVSRIVSFPDGTKKEEKRKVTYKPRVRRVEVHPCRIPEGEPGHTGEDCPVPESDAGSDALPPGE